MEFVTQARDAAEVQAQSKNLMGKMKQIDAFRRGSTIAPPASALGLQQ